jgi:hypothetical protein
VSSLLQDLLNEELTENNVRIIVQRVFDVNFADNAQSSAERSKTSGKSKSLLEFYELVRQAINDMENRASVPKQDRVLFTEEEPDVKSVAETITFSIMKRVPGAFSGGAPFEGNVKNMKPLFREEGPDVEHPGYRYVVTGYWHDNLVRFTCWGRTNKAANKRAEWFEGLMEEYAWWFNMQGVNRVLFWGQDSDIVTTVDGVKWYGRPLDFFVRTEKLKVFTERQLEEILVNLSLSKE